MQEQKCLQKYVKKFVFVHLLFSLNMKTILVDSRRDKKSRLSALKANSLTELSCLVSLRWLALFELLSETCFKGGKNK